MKLMGMKGWLHWAAWYFKFSVFMLISVLVMTLFFHLKYPDGRAVITYADPSITFVFLLLFAVSVMTFCFAISTFFSKGLTVFCACYDSSGVISLNPWESTLFPLLFRFPSLLSPSTLSPSPLPLSPSLLSLLLSSVPLRRRPP